MNIVFSHNHDFNHQLLEKYITKRIHKIKNMPKETSLEFILSKSEEGELDLYKAEITLNSKNNHIRIRDSNLNIYASVDVAIHQLNRQLSEIS